MNAIAQATPAPVTGPALDNRRVLAALIDLAVVAAGAFVVAVVLGAGEPSPALNGIILGWVLYYYFACESGAGQTLGKKAMRLRVVRADGSPAGMREIAIRTVLRVIDGIGFYLVGLIVMLVTGERRQRLGDLAAGTVVTEADPPEPVDVFIPSAAAPLAAVPEAPEAPVAVPDPTTPLAPEPEAEAETADADADAPEPEPDAAPEAPQLAPVADAPEPAEEQPSTPLIDAVLADAPPAELAPVEAPAEPEPAAEEEPSEAAEASVKGVETVSAIDLVMADDEDESQPSPPAEPA